MQQVADWLEKLGLGQYAQRFAENDIDFSRSSQTPGIPGAHRWLSRSDLVPWHVSSIVAPQRDVGNQGMSGRVIERR